MVERIQYIIIVSFKRMYGMKYNGMNYKRRNISNTLFVSGIKSIGLLFTLVFSFSLSALSTKNIYLKDENLSPSLKKIVKNVSNVEELCAYWSPEWESRLSKDSIKTVLTNAINETDYITEEINTFKLCLFRGLLWHYLHQLEVDSGFINAHNIASDLQLRYPDKFEGAWLKGINLVKASKLFGGFRILDSIRTSCDNLPDDFFSDYTKLSALSFLPEEIKFIDTLILWPIENKPSGNIQITIDESQPTGKKWQVVTSPNSGRILPSFIFSAEFGLKKPFKLTFPKQNENINTIAHFTIDDRLVKDIHRPLFFNPVAPPCKMEMKILVENRDMKSSLDTYVYDLVYNQYDVIKPVDKLPDKNIIALKCYNRSFIKGIPDDYTAYVVFDKLCSNQSRRFYRNSKNNCPRDTIITLRYLIAMKTVKDVEEKADMLFQDVIDKFRKFNRE